MMFPHHHQGPLFSTSSRSFRRPPSSQLPRPSIFFASTNIPSYIGSSSSPISPFGTLPRRMSLGSQIGLFCRPIHPMDQQPPEQQQQPYCTVEEIKEGKRQRARRAEEENHYEEQEEEEGEGNGRKGTKGEDGDSSDDYYGLYERAPESRPNSLSELKVQPPLPLPPPLPPPIPFAGKNGQNGGWKKQQQKHQQKLEHSPKEKMFKRRMSRTKLALFLLPLLALCSLLLVLPLLLLWLLSVPSTEWPSNLPENRPKPKPIEWNGQNRLAGKGAAELVMEPEKLAEWMGTRENAPRLRIFEVREGHRREKESPSPMDSFSPSFAPFNVRPLQIGSLSHNGVPVHPLQFQRLLRAQSIDSDSLVILVDRHPLALLAAYALWIFRLYGHEGAFMLNGGFAGWQEFMAKNAQNLTLGQEIEEKRTSAMATTGTFRAEWRHQMIATFDDLLANFDLELGPMADIADAQNPEEFEGKMASSTDSMPSGAVIFGHIRTAVNIPVERLFWPSGQMLPAEEHSRIFAAAGFSPRRPIVVYDGFSSFRAAALWTALHRANYSAALYFGAWPEWLIRAPDHLKIIPDK